MAEPQGIDNRPPIHVRGEVRRPAATRPPTKAWGAPNHSTTEARILARKFLQSKEYRRSMKKRVLAGDAPQLELALWYYAYGKPREQDASPQALIQINMPGVGGAQQPLPEILMMPVPGAKGESAK